MKRKAKDLLENIILERFKLRIKVIKWQRRGTVKVTVAGRMVMRWLCFMHKLVIINYIADSIIQK
jgi:hypothetical protein